MTKRPNGTLTTSSCSETQQIEVDFMLAGYNAVKNYCYNNENWMPSIKLNEFSLISASVWIN